MATDFEDAYRKAKTRYEAGRALRALRNAAIVAAGAWFVSLAVSHENSWHKWLPLTFLAVGIAEWRGTLFMAGARRGVCAGLLSMLLPLSILRPCCGDAATKMVEGASCCTMPSMCWLTGGFVGLGLALLLPQAPQGRRWEAAAGMVVGVISLATLRCSSLFVGEAVGLLGGLTAGVLAASLARAALVSAPQAP